MKKYLFAGLFFFGMVFVFLNSLSSQLISPLYGKIAAGERQAAIEYLKKIKKAPFFSRELSAYKKIYGETIVDDVFRDDYERKKSITRLEELLKKNSGARDVLYRLYLLYKEEGNGQKAAEYFKKTKGVDPMIKP